MFFSVVEYLAKGWAFVLVFTVLAAAVKSAAMGVARYISNKLLLKKLNGKWVVITGATDGIGLGMAREMAAQGANLILISRSKEKLADVKKMFDDKVQVEIASADFTEDIDFGKLLAPFKSKDVRMLVNNVGINAQCPTKYMEHTQQAEDDIIKVNIQNTLKITREFLSWESAPKAMKYVITTGSMLGFIPCPYQQIYTGTKAFLHMWTEAMAEEYSGYYHFELLMTGLVCSKLSGARKSGLFVPTSDYYGKCCVRTMGYSTITYPYLPHAFLGFLYALAPRRFMPLVFKHIGASVRLRRKLREERAKKE
ncbi:17beta-estradiol 17-dehydrogenase / very-long-chain 3-oxoacyl-CoA reductase [Nematocida displodere]|uniref:17beta-estradiol 17-dehydrogenase / very-long-chain 3-oxoacyl-CoA reductase n=1 Tax=Nematocida displodere TaxID=1805483 RepID=A0A177EGL6_9MICR|nr:17beta-estradiol 17-dehydrogenase / very-long-chain 3-oxoacyl-CoA reductase [Nematocida displodere]